MKDILEISIDHPGYPSLLRGITDPPQVLYCRGDVDCLSHPSIALVGTRHPTLYGEKIARMFSEDLAKLGIATVSGLARGIDTCVHEATLKGSGKTIAVMGTGMDQVYPPENKKLSQRIIESGALITDFPEGTVPLPLNFPLRNRIIAGLSLGTVVIEAAERSGALITARLALEQGKDVFAVPGPVTSKVSIGPNRLIQQGAKLAGQVDDILEEIAALASKVRKPGAKKEKRGDPLPLLTREEEDLLNLLSFDPVGIDKLMEKNKWGAGRIHESLLNLELKGAIQSLPGKRYVRIR